MWKDTLFKQKFCDQMNTIIDKEKANGDLSLFTNSISKVTKSQDPYQKPFVKIAY